MVEITDKSIKVTEKTKKLMDSIKIHQRETYDDLINRLISEYKKQGGK